MRNADRPFLDSDRRELHIGQRVRFPWDFPGSHHYLILSMDWEPSTTGKTLPILSVRGRSDSLAYAIAWQVEGSSTHA
jgi:hypothetical protein